CLVFRSDCPCDRCGRFLYILYLVPGLVREKYVHLPAAHAADDTPQLVFRQVVDYFTCHVRFRRISADDFTVRNTPDAMDGTERFPGGYGITCQLEFIDRVAHTLFANIYRIHFALWDGNTCGLGYVHGRFVCTDFSLERDFTRSDLRHYCHRRADFASYSPV